MKQCDNRNQGEDTRLSKLYLMFNNIVHLHLILLIFLNFINYLNESPIHIFKGLSQFYGE